MNEMTFSYISLLFPGKKKTTFVLLIKQITKDGYVERVWNVRSFRSGKMMTCSTLLVAPVILLTIGVAQFAVAFIVVDMDTNGFVVSSPHLSYKCHIAVVSIDILNEDHKYFSNRISIV